MPTGVDGAPVDMLHADVTYGRVAVALPRLALNDDLSAMVRALHDRLAAQRNEMELRNAYYRGTQVIKDLGISIPPSMRGLKITLGWPRVAVDAKDARLNLEGFRFPDSTDVDEEMQDIWLNNQMDSEFPMAKLDALIFGRGYISVGANDDGSALLAVESPLDVVLDTDPRTRRARAGLRVISAPEGESRQAVLYVPDATYGVSERNGRWMIDWADEHNFGEVTIVRVANRSRSYDRDGQSEITPELMQLTDEASRTLVGMAVAREFYAAPQRYILGAEEGAFQDAAGNPKSAWETYLGRVLALERDPEGNVPEVGQFTPYNPSVYTSIIDMYAKAVSALTSVPPHQLGYTTDNPASADAIRSSENALVMWARSASRPMGAGPSDAMRLALRVQRKGAEVDQRIAAVWTDPATPTPAATADALSKMIQTGMIPATSDVTLERAGFDAIERKQLEQDRKFEQGANQVAALAGQLNGQQAPGQLANPVELPQGSNNPSRL